MQVLHSKSGGATDGAKHLMLLRLVEEEWTPIALKTWVSNTISGSLMSKVGWNQVHLGTFDIIKDKLCWQ